MTSPALLIAPVLTQTLSGQSASTIAILPPSTLMILLLPSESITKVSSLDRLTCRITLPLSLISAIFLLLSVLNISGVNDRIINRTIKIKSFRFRGVNIV